MKHCTRIGLFFVALVLAACGKEEKTWTTDVEAVSEPLQWHDVSAVYYDESVSVDSLKRVYPEFFDQVPDSVIAVRRQDSLSRAMHRDVLAKYGNQAALQDSLRDVFGYIKHYYPQFPIPNVYLFTGELDFANPVVYSPESDDLVIGLDWFLGSDYSAYRLMGIPPYIYEFFEPAALKPQLAYNISKHIVPFDIRQNAFINRLIYEGKMMILQDAFVPEASDARKIGYTQEQIEWCRVNEKSIYTYFVEEDMLYGSDRKLIERFIDPAPFTKFFTETDRESPGRVGVWLGWQICRAYLRNNPEVDLDDFIRDIKHDEIFRRSGYKP
ncbi:MAG: hypothetical protein Q4F57_03415 [Weeksellaceae bacterium]|nr:hypothetical protein [Weeksellaceae bacterium]